MTQDYSKTVGNLQLDDQVIQASVLSAIAYNDSIALSYNSLHKLLALSVGDHMTTVNCNDFIKDGMLSSAMLCGTTLVLKFNTDAGSDPISIQLSSLAEGLVTSAMLSSYLNRTTGGEVSGDIEVLLGNYLQTTTPDGIITYGKSNVFIQAESTKYGNASVGSRGFYVLSVIGDRKLKLSGSIDIASDAMSALWSVSIDDKLNSQFSKISAVDGSIVTFADPFDSQIQAKSVSSEAQLVALIGKDDNAFYSPVRADVGNAVLNFSCQHAEGGSVHAIAQYSHAEGRGSIAEGRYAHAEGNFSTAGGAGAHSEGMYTKALGNRSHAEGERTFAYGTGAHAEGYQTSAESNFAHSEGEWTYAKAETSHAEGLKSSARQYASHAEGGYTSADANYAHAEGLSCTASGTNSHAEGYKSIAAAKGAHAEGGSQYDGVTPYSGGYAAGQGSHAEGAETSAIGIFSHAEGYKTLAQGLQSHAEGIYTVASGNRSHAEGVSCTAAGLYSHADGQQTSATAECSHASGKLALANSTRQYVWNGTNAVYDPTAGAGTFCINPANDISGFYIGSGNFIACVLKAVQGMSDSQKIALKNALSISI